VLYALLRLIIIFATHPSGVPGADILIEEQSHNTYENLLNAKRLADARGLRTVGLEAEPSPTPSTRYRGLRSQAGQLAYETYYHVGYLLSRPFLHTSHG
jgi:uncharacterized SAM-binding protein YcdF (DUF218 family)